MRPLSVGRCCCEMAAFTEFVIEQVNRMKQEWLERRAALVAAGKLPEQPGRAGGSK